MSIYEEKILYTYIISVSESQTAVWFVFILKIITEELTHLLLD